MRFVEVAQDGHVRTVRLNRPEAANAISGAMAEELADAFQDASGDEETWVVIVAAAGAKAFCVGADLKERAGFSLEDFHRNRKQIRDLYSSLRAVPQPTIAAVFGFALGGGCEIAMSCDLIVAAEGSSLGLPETSVGLLPAGGGTQLLARRLGPTKAKELIFTARRLDAREAHEAGLVTEVVDRDDVDAGARRLADAICSNSPVAVRAAKRAIDNGLGRPLEDGVEIEHDSWVTVIASDDRAEGIAAFNEKRAPHWGNR